MSYEDEIIKEIKRLEKETIDSRNMSIKTDAGMKNLYAELKQIVYNQQKQSRSVKIHSVFAYLLFVAVIGAAAFLMSTYYNDAVKQQNAQLLDRIAKVEAEAKELRMFKEQTEAGEVHTFSLYESVKNGKDEEAIKLYANLNRKGVNKTLMSMLDKEIAAIRERLAEKHYSEAVNLYKIGSYANAAREYKAAIELSDEMKKKPSIYYNLAFALIESKNYKEALPIIDEAMKQNAKAEDYAKAQYMKGLAIENTGSKEEAVAYYEEAMQTVSRPYYRTKMKERSNALVKKIKKAEDEADEGGEEPAAGGELKKKKRRKD